MDATQVKEYFQQVAGEWDAKRLAWYDERVIEELAERVHVGPETTVLDVGTGTGFVAAGLAPRVARVVGIDHAEAMLEVAHRNLDALGISNVEFSQGDLTHLPLGDDTVDAAVANMVLHHAEDPAAMLQEMARVTGPGGWVAVTDEVEHAYEWMRVEQADLWLGFSQDQVGQFFDTARLEQYGYTALGWQ
jgi:ubiquinone/menaquinone biosynthesis C-methylase UbiE